MSGMRRAAAVFLAGLAASGAWGAGSPEIYRRLKLDRMHEAAPDFGIEGEGGLRRRFADYRGKPVVLHVWASWCTGCVTELPRLALLAREAAQTGLSLLPVSVDAPEKQADARKLLSAAGGAVAYWRPADPREVRRYWAWGLPITYFIDARGEIVARALGPRDWSAVSQADLLSIFQNR